MPPERPDAGDDPRDDATRRPAGDAAAPPLAAALDAADLVGAWEWDLPRDRIVADARFLRYHGLSPEDAARGVPGTAYVAAIHPDDRPALAARLAAALDRDEPLRAEYRVPRPDGGPPRWVLVRGRCVRDASGRPVRLPGAALDVTDQKAAEAALLESEGHLRAISDTAPLIPWFARPDGGRAEDDSRPHPFTGAAPDEAGDGIPEVHPDDRPEARRRWEDALATGEPYEVEFRLRVPGDGWRWFLNRARPVRDAAGAITRWSGTCTDIHEVRRAAEEREVLSHELSHRVRNIFAVVTSLIGLSARRHPGTGDFAADLRGRVEALGQAHEFARLAREPGRFPRPPGTLFAFLRRLLAPYARASDPAGEASDRLRTEGRDRPFDDGAATPLALVFHELGTNAAKFGAFSDPAGHVTVAAEDRGDDLVLTWREEGGPPLPGPPDREGLGTQLAALAVQGQLGGRMERRWLPGGLEVEMRVPTGALHRRGAPITGDG